MTTRTNTTNTNTTRTNTTNTTNTNTAATTVRRSIVVDASLERAFEFFTRDIGAWWDPDKHLLPEPLAKMVFETHVGGHIIDYSVHGTESHWGTVLAYEPPTYVAFRWNIDLTWQIEADPGRASEVHVSFRAQGDRRTLVELEHRHLDRHGDGWEGMRDAVASPNGWNLEPYANALTASA